MPSGRPRKPILLAARDGDTRKMGRKKFEAHIAAAHIAERGIPAMPSILRARKGDSDAVKARLKIAREHWLYVAKSLDGQGMMAKCDEGMLTSLALAYAQMVEAGRAGAVRLYTSLHEGYLKSANAMGLNESARARIPKGAPALSANKFAKLG